MEASEHDKAFAQPLFTQPQSCDEASAGVRAGPFSGSGENCGDPQASGETGADSADDGVDESSIFEVQECNVNRRDDEAFDDGFNLLTQSNDLFKDVASDDDGEFSNDGSNDESSDSESSNSSGEDDDDSLVENQEDETPLQERRARNVKRNEDFWVETRERFNEMIRTTGEGQLETTGRKREAITEQEDVGAPERDEDVKGGVIQRKRRRILLPKPSHHNHQQSFAHSTVTRKSLADELNPKYPQRSREILSLCSQLACVVQKTKYCWKMKNNVRSSGNTHYSEASYSGDIKLACPSPVVITGTGGVGKTCIVRDAMDVLQRITNEGGGARVHPTVGHAYVDCASSESGTVAAVMDGAYRQLYQCFQRADGKVQEKRGESNSGIARLNFGGVDFGADFESEAEDEDADAEDLIERQRKRRSGKSSGSQSNKRGKARADNETLHNKNARQTRSRTTLATSVVTQPVFEQSRGLKGSIQGNANRRTHSGGSVALFGRAVSALIQGGASKKKSKNGRCTFLILDNADRILSWQKHGSANILTQIMMLPSIMGINLQLILISRSTLLLNSPVHNAPGRLCDAVHPTNIHFGSYNSVEMIQIILHVRHVKSSITGPSATASLMFSCTIANTLRAELNELLYTSMIKSFVPSVKSSTQDITEIKRLARLLWPVYVAPLRKTQRGDPSLKALVWQALICLKRDTEPTNDHCNEPNCSFCQRLSSEAGGDASVMDLGVIKKRLSEKLGRNIREDMRQLLSSTVMMPGRVLQKQNCEPYASRLPYTTKFLLLAAFLCQNKRPVQDINLFTTRNTGKSKRGHTKKSGEEVAYASTSMKIKQRQPSFPLERLYSVFYSIIGQYGQHYMNYKEEGVIVAQLGTELLFKEISQLIRLGLLSNPGGAEFDEKYKHDLLDMTSAKFSCMVSRDDANAIASCVSFPLEKYCP